MITAKNVLIVGDHLEISEIEVLVDIFVSPFNFANMSSKYIANLAVTT